MGYSRIDSAAERLCASRAVVSTRKFPGPACCTRGTWAQVKTPVASRPRRAIALLRQVGEPCGRSVTTFLSAHTGTSRAGTVFHPTPADIPWPPRRTPPVGGTAIRHFDPTRAPSGPLLEGPYGGRPGRSGTRPACAAPGHPPG